MISTALLTVTFELRTITLGCIQKANILYLLNAFKYI